MNFNGTIDMQNTAKTVQEILKAKIVNEIDNLEDGYGIDPELLDSLQMNLYVNQSSKVLWKSTNTKFVKAYEKEVDRLIMEDVISFEDLGLLLFLSNHYTNYEDNYLKMDGELLTKKELIEDLHNITKNKANSSISFYKKKLIELENKNLIISEPHPKNKRQKIFYLSPQLFYKGKHMDSKVKEKLINISKSTYEDIKKLNNEGKTNIPLDSNFENKSDTQLANEIMEYINNAS